MSLGTLFLILLLSFLSQPIALLVVVLLTLFFVVKKTRLSRLNWRSKLLLFSTLSCVVLGLQYFLITFLTSDSRPPFTTIYMFYGSLFLLIMAVALIIAKRMSKEKV